MLLLALSAVLFVQLLARALGTGSASLAVTSATTVAPPPPSPLPTLAATQLPIAAEALPAATVAGLLRAPTQEEAPTPTPTVDAAAVLATEVAEIAAEEQARVAMHLSDTLGVASSGYAPDLERLLLENGYYANIITIGEQRGLRASQKAYTNSVWTRDLDYAISGYSYALGDMRVLRENIEVFLVRVDENGVAPETIYLREGRLDHENRRSWDSMPNLIHAVYVYVGKTGDRAFYLKHRDTLQRVGAWIVALDVDGDGLPDGDEWPYGYYDSVVNGVMHTYAIAKFYSAFNELAELDAASGFDGGSWREQAARLREGFHRPFAAGGKGYWLPEQPWPVAWHRSDGSVVPMLETFGVFEALRSGLISPADGERYQILLQTLHESLPTLLEGPSPLRLTLGGYEPEMRREVDPPVPLWMLDASAPWIVGLAAPALAGVYPEDAAATLDAYMQMARTTEPPVLEFAAGEGARYGPGNSGDGGRAWDSAAFFLALYGGHYGLALTPQQLIVQPRPFLTLPDDGVQNISYQGAVLQLSLDVAQRQYRLRTDRPTVARLFPMGASPLLRLNDGEPVTDVVLVLQPGQEYLVTSIQP